MTRYTISLQAYELVTPRKIVFGWGSRSALVEELPRLGNRALVIGGSRTLEKTGALDEIRNYVEKAGVAWEFVACISREPLVADVDEVTLRIKELGTRPGDVVLAIGGGSAIDLAKAVAGMVTNTQGESVRDYLENVGRGLKLTRPPLPVVALPTTAGTGAEATRNAVISNLDPPFKRSLRDDRLMPVLAIVDPELTVTQPPAVTAHSGLDAITQLIESFVSVRRKPIPQILAAEGLRLALNSLRTAYHHPEDRAAREAMAQAALLSGICLANSGLGMAHGIAAALGAVAGIPHGLACALMLPVALRVNRDVAAGALAYLARTALERDFPEDFQAVDALISEIERLLEDLNVPRALGALGVKAGDIPTIAHGAFGSSMSGNPRKISPQEVEEMLRAML